MTRVKICGLTNLADARVALESGADLLGFNFYRPSPRYIAPESASAVIAALRAEFGDKVLCVGVFVNAPLAEVFAIQRQCDLDLLQMSGDESPEYMRSAGVRAFKGLRPTTPSAAHHDMTIFGDITNANEPRFLLDASHPQLYGGTGKTSDWMLARQIASRYPILLAGGLTPANVATGIESVRPWGVDVASGVERAPGLKDPAKMRAFIQAAKGTNDG